MRYGFAFQPQVRRQLNGFPADALDGLISAMADVTAYPDDPLRTWPVAGRPDERRADFGPGGAGMVTYLIDEAARMIRVTDVTWAG